MQKAVEMLSAVIFHPVPPFMLQFHITVTITAAVGALRLIMLLVKEKRTPFKNSILTLLCLQLLLPSL